MFISKKKHDAIVKDLRQDVRALEATAKLYQQQRNTARAEADANKADAEKYRRMTAGLSKGTAASAAKRKAAVNGAPVDSGTF